MTLFSENLGSMDPLATPMWVSPLKRRRYTIAPLLVFLHSASQANKGRVNDFLANNSFSW